MSYTLASGVGSLTPPGGNNKAIQFNSGSGFSGSNDFIYDYDNDAVILTGSFSVTNGFTGSLFGTASYITGSIFDSTNPALSSSYALSSSFVTSASYALSSSYVLSSSYAFSSSYALSSSYTFSSSYALSSSYAFSSSYALSSSFVESASYALSSSRAVSSSFALSASRSTTASYALFALNGGESTLPEGSSGEIQYNNGGVFGGVPTLTYDGFTLIATGSFTGSFIGTSSWAVQALSSIFATTASYIFGDIFDSTNPALSASYALSSSYVLSSSYALSSSYVLSSSYALTASFVATASYVTGALFTNINPALTASHALTASFVRTAQTASYVTGSIFTNTNPALSASYALSASSATTASYVLGSIFTSTNQALTASFALTSSFSSNTRAGSASVASFTSPGGDNYISTVTLSPSFPNNNYAITVTGEDARSWTIQSKTNTTFVINSNSTTVLTGPVYWIAMQFNS